MAFFPEKNWYNIESQTASGTKMDISIDYLDKRYVLEVKIWRGKKKMEEGYDQLVGYLNANGINKGYMLVYNFNLKSNTNFKTITWKNKEIFIAEIGNLNDSS